MQKQSKRTSGSGPVWKNRRACAQPLAYEMQKLIWDCTQTPPATRIAARILICMRKAPKTFLIRPLLENCSDCDRTPSQQSSLECRLWLIPPGSATLIQIRVNHSLTSIHFFRFCSFFFGSPANNGRRFFWWRSASGVPFSQFLELDVYLHCPPLVVVVAIMRAPL